MKDNRAVHDHVMEPLESLVRYRLACQNPIVVNPFRKGEKNSYYPGMRITTALTDGNGISRDGKAACLASRVGSSQTA
jgi:hypothetical protein